MEMSAQADQNNYADVGAIRKSSFESPSFSSTKPRPCFSRGKFGLLPDPHPAQVGIVSPVVHTPTHESVAHSEWPVSQNRSGLVSPILSYGRLPVLAPPAPYPGYFVETVPVVDVPRSDEPRLESKDDFPDISATVTSKRKSFGKFPKKRHQMRYSMLCSK